MEHRFVCVLRPIHSIGSPIQHATEEIQETIILSGYSHCLLGHRDDNDGGGQELRWIADHTHPSGRLRVSNKRKNHGPLLILSFRAGFFPGAVYLCAYWYMPRDLATRISYFYCASALSGAFSGLLAAGIAKMDGVGGYEGWRWIFLLEGIVTVMLGVACFFLLIDSPALSGRWLKPDEIRFLELQKFIKDGGKFQEENEKHFRWKDLKMVLCNWRLYMQAYILLCISACSYGMFDELF